MNEQDPNMPGPPKSRFWLWFLLIIFGLPILAIGILFAGCWLSGGIDFR